MTYSELQGPGLSVTFFGVMWAGKTKVMLEAVTDRAQAFPSPHLFPSYRILGSSWAIGDPSMPHLAQILRPLYRLVRKGVPWGWDTRHTEAIITAKRAVKRVQVPSPDVPVNWVWLVPRTAAARACGNGKRDGVCLLACGRSYGKELNSGAAPLRNSSEVSRALRQRGPPVGHPQ